jgi:CRISPR-associated protein Cmr2
VGIRAAQEDSRDLVVIALPGVQSFIEESRSTSDVSAASQIYAALAAVVIGSLRSEDDADLILPDYRVENVAAGSPESSGAPGVPGVPNRIVVSFPAGVGSAAAERAAVAARSTWHEWLCDVLGRTSNVPETPGFPRLQWACVSAVPGYKAQWEQVQRLMAGRSQVRDFPVVPDEQWRQRVLCTLSPRWPAEEQVPPRTPAHEKDLKLSAVGWVKHRWHRMNRQDGFPSTASIASAPYRQAVLRHLGHDVVRVAVRRLRDAVGQIEGTAPETAVPGLVTPGEGDRWFATSAGPWVYPDSWQLESIAREAGLFRPGRDAEMPAQVRERLGPVVEAGRRAARDLRDAMAGLPAAPPLAKYLAVVVQDLDSMGLFLSGKARSAAGQVLSISQDEHRRVSLELLDVAAAQRAALRDGALLGVPVYAGGDDLLAFVPASTALAAAERCHDAIPLSLPTASTAVLFFHYHASIQAAMSQARRLLKDAKEHVEGKHALAVGYLRRSGTSAVSIQPWPGREGASSAELFRLFALGGAEQLSPRLVSDLERDAGELAALRAASERLYLAELARLVRRHTEGGEAVTSEAVGALDWLGLHERLDGQAGVARPQAAARVGVFLRQEAR